MLLNVEVHVLVFVNYCTEGEICRFLSFKHVGARNQYTLKAI